MPSNSPTPASSFDVLTGFERDPVLTAAARATTRAVDDETLGVVVVVVRPDTEAMQVISGGGTGVLRAAVSVAAAAGNDRLWRVIGICRIEWFRWVTWPSCSIASVSELKIRCWWVIETVRAC